MRGPDRKATSRARQLRIHQTDAETKLWHRLRNRQIAGCKFVRQEPVGRYVCDFICRERKLVIEVDGGQHAEAKADIVRSDTLAQGYRVLRFWNNEVLGNIEGVLQTVESKLLDREPLTLNSCPSPRPSPRKERGEGEDA